MKTLSRRRLRERAHDQLQHAPVRKQPALQVVLFHRYAPYPAAKSTDHQQQDEDHARAPNPCRALASLRCRVHPGPAPRLQVDLGPGGRRSSGLGVGPERCRCRIATRHLVAGKPAVDVGPQAIDGLRMRFWSSHLEILLAV